ncbi:MAG: ribosomal subunit interface protein [Candidatus Zambryskibacteria bacterium RIFOXYC1_FULL_39_10]|uniref:Ribosomal subunit interface protein n=1 Tax=Candidatus Zambryskibacteria bacterium RIFOXYC1_FULL_39_10 TaxID=1802779 RepID=A0A1G2UYU3_9BACT|nr:MAG: ribosomal subunit interface protein [Candidatus Zambryskibacteria bacterium RIFOXYC1_FULL_39_10]OHB15440.1 MAG: ribosomal subunit interface protein [Candidatus Zambryskibacteria bacterium RIFOXYD1_FULL_39_35]
MKINIKGTNISLTPSISEYVEKKVNMLEKFFHNIDEVLVNVEVGKTTKHHKSGDFFRAEIQVIANGQTYYAVSETEDLYASIDKVKDDIAQELSSKKRKTMRLFRRGGAKIKELLRGLRGQK